MARTTKLMALVFIIHAILVFTGLADAPGSGLYTMLTNPQDWGLNSLYSFMNDLMLLAGVTGVVVGSLFRNDLLTFGGFAGIVLSFGASLGELYSLVNSSLGTEVAILLVSNIVLLYVMSAVSFWRGQTN